MQSAHRPADDRATAEARRRFLAACGRFALATPPAISLMLAGSERNYATAASGGGPQGNNGFGNGGGDGVPGNSGNNASPNAGQKSADEVR
ncbi:MAG: hypothetical protein L6R19_09905 [Alphaproteobacteria bacterium]|nr:hypothetical protein [Alphaproteobacteria bacterium]